jgi:hypothetical protein
MHRTCGTHDGDEKYALYLREETASKHTRRWEDNIKIGLKK